MRTVGTAVVVVVFELLLPLQAVKFTQITDISNAMNNFFKILMVISS